MTTQIQQITIVGVGLIGGSVGLGLRGAGFAGKLVGCDREEVLRKARERGAIDEGASDPGQAVRGSDLVVLATPVGAILDFLERLGPVLPETTFVTDVGSTKVEIVRKARLVWGDAAGERFLGGHPMAGKEHSGVQHADAELFRGAAWLFVPAEGGRAASWKEWVGRMGAKVMEVEAERHDRLCAWVSHLPQMMATALGSALQEEIGGDQDARAVGGRALREMTRIAGSPYSMWRDIAFTNTANIEEALLQLEQKLAHIRENLRTGELKAEFEAGNRFDREIGKSGNR